LRAWKPIVGFTLSATLYKTPLNRQRVHFVYTTNIWTSPRSFPRADFAFLSACQTATGDKRLPEEAIHLAAGLMLAGYRGVIATMWSIQDKDAPVIADHVYAKLFKDTQQNSTGAALALHHAVKLLRQQVGDSAFLSWVPFIHVGV